MALPIRSAARDFSLPIRERRPGTGILAKDVLPKKVLERDVDEFNLRSFLHEFCIKPTGPATSYGFLCGMEPRLRRLDEQSNLAKACKMVAIASQGTKLNRPAVLTPKCEKLNHDLVASLAIALQHQSAASTKDDYLVVMLLGLYEVSCTLKPVATWSNDGKIIIANDSRIGFHIVHTSGLAAILGLKNHPISLLEARRDGKSLGSPRKGFTVCFPFLPTNIETKLLASRMANKVYSLCPISRLRPNP